MVPEKVQIRRIHIKAGEKRSAEEAKGIAEDLRKQLVDAPEKFKALAKDNSEDPYRKRGVTWASLPKKQARDSE